jgi:two-component system phosphate regulon response regulator PhoB
MDFAESGTERHVKDPKKPRGSSPRGARREPVTAPILGAEPKIPEVIIVEGDTALAEMLEYSVANAGRPSRTFRKGDAAIGYLLKDLPPAHAPVVLLDLDLLGSEGFLGLQQVVEARPDARVIVLSAQGAERDQIRALRAGAIDYLVKPLSIPVLIAKVERLLADR